MASASASFIQKNFKYDVFLSFRGEDTRNNFVDHLHHALNQKNIKTYRDDEEVKKGKSISSELMRSIKDSKFYIIVFSKTYASSSWCLDELVKIIECHKTNEHTAFPIFYDVEPTEVRNQSGAFGKAFTENKEKEDAEKWRDALREASNLAGWELKKLFDGHEAKLIQNIVEEISTELRFINPNIDEKLVGMDTRVNYVVSSLETDIEDVRMIGIRGMGGAGKTTLARAVFDQISFRFQGSSFIENVRETSKNPSWGLKSLQKQILSNVSNDPLVTVDGVFEGKKKMKKILCGIKVLIVLDDVDHIDQLQALAGEPNWFKPGSRVIVTTRDEQVLAAHRVNIILDVNLLSYEEAFCLFIKYAFGREIPNQGYEKLANQVVRYAAGLPLTIKVLGSFLCGKDELEWTDALERLKTIPLRETQEILELSYDSLEDDYKEIFLDVACLLKGWKKEEEAIIALESRGYHAINGLKVLELKSLITVSDSGRLSMHDHIEEMGKNIVRRLHPNEPCKHSRLWIGEEIKNIVLEEKDTELIRCIKVRMVDGITVMNGLQKMKELKFLDFHYGNSHNIHFAENKEYADNIVKDLYLPNGLRYLRWYGNYPLRCLPKNLVGLQMIDSKCDQLWEGGEKKVLKELRFIDLKHCNLRSLDIGLIMNVERLRIRRCVKLRELHMPIESLKLKRISLSRMRLTTLNLKGAPNLEILYLKECVCLEELHMPVESLKLKRLVLYYTPLETLNLKGSRNLEELYISKCSYLVELHMPVESLNLKHICIKHCKLKTLNLTQALNIETLDLYDFEVRGDHDMVIGSFEGRFTGIFSFDKKITLDFTRYLDTFILINCTHIIELHMPDESSRVKSIKLSCSSLRVLYLGMSPYLECLDLYDCYNLVEIHAPVGCLKKLARIKLRGCVRFKSFKVNQGCFEVDSLPELHLTARSLDICPLHPENNLPKFQFECNYKEFLPSSTGNLEKLISFGLCACTNLASFSESICGLQCLRKLTLGGSLPEVPKEISQLECLEQLTFSSIKIEHLPHSISLLKHLKILRLEQCSILEQLPKDLDRLECLEELHITNCISLRDIPRSICEIKHLKCFHLPYCILVEKLPEEIGRLECLKELNVKGTCISHLPRNIFKMKGLIIIGSRRQLESYGFTFVMTNRKYTAFCYI